METNRSLLTTAERDDLADSKTQYGYRKIVLIESLLKHTENDMNHRIADVLNRLPEMYVAETIQGTSPYLDVSILDVKPVKRKARKSA